MIDRKEAIDTFLKGWKTVIEENPNIELSRKQIYSQLVRIGVSNKDRNVRLSKTLFDKWIKRFSKKKNIKCFVSPNWTYFCQFTNRDDIVLSQPEQIKIYIPQDAAHIEKSANMIFDFLSHNDIPHHSKIGSDVRFDDIVIRLATKEDADKLLAFVESNRYIQQGLIVANPFTFSSNNIAMACDGDISYNCTVAYYISIYLNTRRKEQALDKIGYEDFYVFVSEYTHKFTYKEGLDEITRDFELKSEVSQGKTLASVITNYFNVSSLIINANDPHFNEESYYHHFDECNSRSALRRKDEQFSQVLYGEEKESDIAATLRWAVEAMSSKYTIPEALVHIKEYIESGNALCLSRTGGVRERICNSSFRQRMISILKERNMSIEGYYQYIAESTKFEEQESPTIDLELQKEMMDLLQEALSLLTARFDYETALRNIKGFLDNNDPYLITSRNNLRERIMHSPFRDFFNQYLKDNNMTFGQLISKLNPQLDSPANALEKAIMETYKKYQDLYEKGQYEYTGKQQVAFALRKLLLEYSYMGFTGQNNARHLLQSSLTLDECIKIIREATKISAQSASYPNSSEVDLLVTTYVDIVLAKEKDKQY